MQTFERSLEYSKDFVLSAFDRFRGGINEGIPFLRAAASADGVNLPIDDEDAMFASLMVELQDLIDRKLGQPEQADGADFVPRKGTLAWYIHHRHDPVAPGSELTLLQVCYSIMFTKHYRGTNDVGMEELCGLLAVGGLLPPENIMPKCVFVVNVSTALC